MYWITLTLSCKAQQQVTTPNLSLQLPQFGQTNWQVPLQYDLYRLDSLTLQVPPANGVPFYIGSGASRLATQADIQALLGQAGANSSGWLSTTDWNRFNTGLGNSLAAPGSAGIIKWTGSATTDAATADIVALLNGANTLSVGTLGATSLNLKQGSYAATLSPATTMTASYNWQFPSADGNGVLVIQNDLLTLMQTLPLGYVATTVTTDPSGSCTASSTTLEINSNSPYDVSACLAGTWRVIATGSGGGGGGGIGTLNATSPITGSITGTTLNLALATVPVTSGGTGATTASAALSNLGAQAAGNYITALTGDGSASGPGSAAFTLASVNGSPGTCGDATHVCQVTSDGKGRITTTSAIAISSMVYPGAGIPVSTGSAWTTSKAAPAGALVGTTDTQTLTNKTVDGVSPAIFGYLDATSSIQTQLNTKLSGVAIQQNGGALGSAQTINFSSNLTATVAGGVATVVATGGGGGGSTGGTFATAASNTSTLTVGTDCTTGTPCMARVGSLTLAQITASMTATASTGRGTNDTAYIYFDTANGNALTIGDSGTVTLSTPGSGAGSGMVVAGSAITGFPVQSLPLFSATIVGDNFTAVTNYRAQYSVASPIAAGSCAIITRTIDLTTIGFDSTCAGGGGSSFNGGTITAPLTISTNGLSTNTPLLKLILSNAGGYNVLEMDDDLGDGWQFGVGGSGAAAPYKSALYIHDDHTANTFFSVDPTGDFVTFHSVDATGTTAQFNGVGQYGSHILIGNTYSGTTTESTLGTTWQGLVEFGMPQSVGSATWVYPFHLNPNGSFALVSGGVVQWSTDSSNSSNGTMDTSIVRESAGIVGIKNSSNAPGIIDAGSFAASGVTGYSGTKVAGACTITFAGGIVTNVTGC